MGKKLKSCKRIAILTLYPFPHGLAATNRIIAYARGLISNNVTVDVFISNSIKLTENSPEFVGNYKGIYYEYAQKHVASNYKLIHMIELIYGIIKSCIIIKRRGRENQYDYVFLTTDLIYYCLTAIPFLKLTRTKIVFIGDEYPNPIRSKLKDNISFIRKCLYRIIYKGIKLRILMTKHLKVFYDDNICYKPTYIMSSIVDIDHFILSSPIQSKRPYICYMGNMDLTKDNVDNIILAFSIISDVFPSYDLLLYGQPTKGDEIIIKNLVTCKNLDTRVYLKGRVLFSQVPGILKGASLLVSSQPKTMRAEGGFPTKLSEYMLSGKPVLLTDVGEISNTITDGVNAFLVPPCDPIKYSQKISWILNNYDKALQVAQKGEEFIINNYSSEVVTENLKKFLDKYLNL